MRPLNPVISALEFLLMRRSFRNLSMLLFEARLVSMTICHPYIHMYIVQSTLNIYTCRIHIREDPNTDMVRLVLVSLCVGHVSCACLWRKLFACLFIDASIYFCL